MGNGLDPVVEGWMTSLSNWGRWGDDDELGTLNLIDDDKRRSAAAEVIDGAIVSCAHDVMPGRNDVQRYMIGTGLERAPDASTSDRKGASDAGRTAVAAEFLGMIFHGMFLTHLDAPSHVFWDGRMYNGAPSSAVNDFQGATRNDVRDAGQGVVTRGVLLDIAALHDVERLDPSHPIMAADLDAAAAKQEVTVEPGDALLVRTGEAIRRGSERGYRGHDQPGLHADCLPWLHGHDISILASDVAQDVRPSGVEGFGMPIHTVGLVAMGLWLIDNCDLEALAAACAERSRWSFQFILSPLRIRGATGSPANPLAVF